MVYFPVRYDSRVVIYERKMFIRLATDWAKFLNFGKILKVFGYFWRVFLYLAKYYTYFGYFFCLARNMSVEIFNAFFKGNWFETRFVLSTLLKLIVAKTMKEGDKIAKKL